MKMFNENVCVEEGLLYLLHRNCRAWRFATHNS